MKNKFCKRSFCLFVKRRLKFNIENCFPNRIGEQFRRMGCDRYESKLVLSCHVMSFQIIFVRGIGSTVCGSRHLHAFERRRYMFPLLRSCVELGSKIRRDWMVLLLLARHNSY